MASLQINAFYLFSISVTDILSTTTSLPVLLIIRGARKSFHSDETSLWVSPRVGVKENQIDERPTKNKNVFDKKKEQEKAFTPLVIFMQLT